MFGGHFKVVESAVGPGLVEVGFGAGVFLHEVAKISLAVLRGYAA